MLSSTEAEWITLSEATKEIIFVLQLVESLGIKINLPIAVRVDNSGAIFMSKNINTTGTKHIGVWNKYVSKNCEDRVIKIIFVELAETDASKLISIEKQAGWGTSSILGAFWW